ncbi:hypothetical protein [Endozoicomonas euniceicola]|uniref:Phage protein n=1 Tax=Endozoicomonas euniceicola TaxID=1234143 RepID=A0ABY6GQC0_9GAMM|nr:hypothetical protein [Endozoicomonas euniceicola]UYM14293.1 hypothetical protein NX720_15450 [Endozoicomonas euniceicola]
MPKYRKKPVIVDAIQWSGRWEDVPEVKKFTENNAVEKNDIDNKRSYLFIRTLEGEMMCSPFDYIIRGVKGEYYPCKPDIFEATYELAE